MAVTDLREACRQREEQTARGGGHRGGRCPVVYHLNQTRFELGRSGHPGEGHFLHGLVCVCPGWGLTPTPVGLRAPSSCLGAVQTARDHRMRAPCASPRVTPWLTGGGAAWAGRESGSPLRSVAKRNPTAFPDVIISSGRLQWSYTNLVPQLLKLWLSWKVPTSHFYKITILGAVTQAASWWSRDK